jgi:adenylate cyclase
MVVAAVLVPAFNVLTVDYAVRPAIQGLVDAVIVPLLVGSYLLFVRDGSLRGWFRRRGFWADIALSSAAMVVLFLVGRALGQVVTTGSPRRFVQSFTDEHLAWALPFFVVMAVAIQLVLQMNRLIGANVLRYFMAGIYHRPRPEERIFLFLDLEGSTQLAERLGSARYFELLRRLVDDLTEPVLATQGEIYQYAGDEIVVTWPLALGVRSGNCVRCFFAIRSALLLQSGRYQRDFGAVPRLRGGLHGGDVTAGEIGDLKMQIVFVGDILNTAARLEEYAKREALDLVVSGSLLERLELPSGLSASRCGELALRGKEERVIAFRVEG